MFLLLHAYACGGLGTCDVATVRATFDAISRAYLSYRTTPPRRTPCRAPPRWHAFNTLHFTRSWHTRTHSSPAISPLPRAIFLQLLSESRARCRHSGTTSARLADLPRASVPHTASGRCTFVKRHGGNRRTRQHARDCRCCALLRTHRRQQARVTLSNITAWGRCTKARVVK